MYKKISSKHSEDKNDDIFEEEKKIENCGNK